MPRAGRGLLWSALLGVVSALAWNPSPAGLAEQPTQTGRLQLDELGQAFRPEYTGYMAAGWMFLPLPSQSALRTEWGVHEGFAFRQRLAAWLTNPLEKTPLRLGLAWWVERQGWDSEDFVALPAYGRFGRVQSVQTLGMTVADSARRWGAGAGIQFLNVEYVGQSQLPADDSLYWWSLAQWGPATVRSLYHGVSWREWHLALDLQGRALRGGASSGWKTYLPDLDAMVSRRVDGGKGVFPDDRGYRVAWEQNLYAQKCYGVVSWAGTFNGERESLGYSGDAWGALRFHPDVSHLVTFDVTATSADGGVLWGGGVKLPFIRVAYNHADDYQNFFQARGLWVVEARLAIGSARDAFFELGAPKRAPAEALTRKVNGNFDKGDVERGHVEPGGSAP